MLCWLGFFNMLQINCFGNIWMALRRTLTMTVVLKRTFRYLQQNSTATVNRGLMVPTVADTARWSEEKLGAVVAGQLECMVVACQSAGSSTVVGCSQSG